jgi:hypothetical protein
LVIPGGVANAAGENLVTSCWQWASAGTLAGVNFSRIGNSAGGQSSLTTPQISTAPQRLQTVRVGAGSPVASGWRYDCTAGSAIDITITYVLPQQENAAAANFASAPIVPPTGAPAASARAQGSVSIPVQQLGARWNCRQGILILDWNSQPGPFTSAADADWFGLISWGDTTANERLGLLLNPAHTRIEARCTAGGAVQTASAVTITAPAAGVTTRAAVAWDLDAGFLQAAARGLAGSKVALTALPIQGFIMPGRYATSNPLFGRTRDAEIRPAALFDAALAALT